MRDHPDLVATEVVVVVVEVEVEVEVVVVVGMIVVGVTMVVEVEGVVLHFVTSKFMLVQNILIY
jgi:hypothetical protein